MVARCREIISSSGAKMGHQYRCACGQSAAMLAAKFWPSYPTLKKLEKQEKVLTRNGVLEGDRGKKLSSDFGKRRYLSTPKFPVGTFLKLIAKDVPLWKNPSISTRDTAANFEPFKAPQLLIKKVLQAKSLRLQSVLVDSGPNEWGVICKESYITVREMANKPDYIERACLALNNSLIAPYFLTLTTNIGVYITKASVEDLLSVPLPSGPVDLSNIHSIEELDTAAKKYFPLTAADWQLIEDFLEYTLPDALRKTPGIGRNSTRRNSEQNVPEPDLSAYCDAVLRVIKSTYGSAKSISTTIYSESGGEKLPVRMVTIRLNTPSQRAISFETINADGLFDELKKFYNEQLTRKTRATAGGGGLGFQRVAYLVRSDKSGMISLTFIKPDERRYWLRSLAMRDADQIAMLLLKTTIKKIAYHAALPHA